MKEIKAIVQPFRVSKILEALQQIPQLPGVTVSDVRGFGRQRAVNAPNLVVEGIISYAKKPSWKLWSPMNSWKRSFGTMPTPAI